MRYLRYLYPTCLVVLLLSMPAYSQSLLSESDLFAAQTEYSNYFSPTLQMRHQTILQGKPFFSDGAYGYEIVPEFEVGTLPLTGNPSRDPLILARDEYCASSLVVVAKANSSESALLPNNLGVVTGTSFTIQKVLREDGAHGTGSQITAIGFGGTVKTGSKLVRVQVRGVAPFRAGDSYLLFLHANDTLSGAGLFVSGFHKDKVSKDGTLRPSTRVSDEVIANPVRSGEAVGAYFDRLTKYLDSHPCR